MAMRPAAPLTTAVAAAVSAALLGGALLGASAARAQSVSLRDDAEREIFLPAPARRVITLAPHATELVYAAGAGARLVATVESSNYPDAAHRVPRIGQGLVLDPERIAAYTPDLVIGWQTGRLDPAASTLSRLGVPLYVSAPARLTDLPPAIRQVGVLMGTQTVAESAAAQLSERLQKMEGAHAARQPVLRAYVQAGSNPLYTLNGEHIVSDALRLCGAVNVFASLAAAAPRIGLESVLAADPDLLIVTDEREVEAWRQHGLPAARLNRVAVVDPDILFRPGPRMVDAAEQLCAVLDGIRQDTGGSANGR